MKIINKSVPTVMFHSLSYSLKDPFYLAFPTHLFVDNIETLIRSGFHFVTIEQIVNQTIDNNKKNVCFTFDDGFKDNYTILFPILKYFNIPCTVFISSDFVAIDRFGNTSDKSRTWMRNFLSKRQIIEMHKSGLIDFQGHSRTHTWYPTAGEVLEQHNISSIEKYYWIYWNAFPEKKPYIIDKSIYSSHSEFVTFNYDRSLASRRFIPDGDEFSSSGKKHVTGAVETDDEMIARFREEIIWDKANLENLLQKNLCFFCWPGGEMCKESYSVFKQSGYKACSVPSIPHNLLIAEDIFLDNQPVIRRISPSYYWKEILLGSRYFLHTVKQYNRNPVRRWLFRKLIPRLLRIQKVLLESVI